MPTPMTKAEDDRHGIPHWTRLMTTAARTEAELILGLLEAHEIPAMILDLGSTTYPMLGEVAILVDRDHAIRARHLLETRGA